MSSCISLPTFSFLTSHFHILIKSKISPEFLLPILQRGDRERGPARERLMEKVTAEQRLVRGEVVSHVGSRVKNIAGRRPSGRISLGI